ncbi:hypothetical protein BKA57DRAFT_468531 [Linnemannia elongata]|nr:hypothetical protein BKA57DRAFT_468531 [Linnemannia elongata]
MLVYRQPSSKQAGKQAKHQTGRCIAQMNKSATAHSNGIFFFVCLCVCRLSRVVASIHRSFTMQAGSMFTMAVISSCFFSFLSLFPYSL